MPHNRVIGSIEFHVHRKSTGSSMRQARVFIEGHGFHVVDWPLRRISIERRLADGYILRVRHTHKTFHATIVVAATDHRIFEGILEQVPSSHVPSRRTFTITL